MFKFLASFFGPKNTPVDNVRAIINGMVPKAYEEMIQMQRRFSCFLGANKLGRYAPGSGLGKEDIHDLDNRMRNVLREAKLNKQ